MLNGIASVGSRASLKRHFLDTDKPWAVPHLYFSISQGGTWGWRSRRASLQTTRRPRGLHCGSARGISDESILPRNSLTGPLFLREYVKLSVYACKVSHFLVCVCDVCATHDAAALQPARLREGGVRVCSDSGLKRVLARLRAKGVLIGRECSDSGRPPDCAV